MMDNRVWFCVLAIAAILPVTGCRKAETVTNPPVPSESPASPDAPAAPEPLSPARFEGKWNILTLDGASLRRFSEADPAPGIVFDQGRVSTYTGCNSGGNDIEWSARGFKATGLLVSTQIGCGELTEQEGVIYAILQGATIELANNVLTLRSTDHVMTLTRP